MPQNVQPRMGLNMKGRHPVSGVRWRARGNVVRPLQGRRDARRWSVGFAHGYSDSIPSGSRGRGGHVRVLRGGSWNNNPYNCRSSKRNRNEPDNSNNNYGFRVVCVSGAFFLARGLPFGVPRLRGIFGGCFNDPRKRGTPNGGRARGKNPDPLLRWRQRHPKSAVTPAGLVGKDSERPAGG